MTESDLRKLSTFHTKCLVKILHMFWPQTISNKHLLIQCELECICTIIMQRRWRWIGHVIRRERDPFSTTALHWTPKGRRTRGRPKNTWRCIVETEMRGLGHNWSFIQKLAGDRQLRGSFVAALFASEHDG